MTGKVTRQDIDKEVTFLHDVSIDFVSLVRHGANQQAFKVIKQEGGVSENMNKVIQSILLANDMNMEKLSSMDGLGYLTEAKTDEIQEFDNYKKYVQTNEKKFEKDSLSLVRLGEIGYAIVGKLKMDTDDKDVLILGVSAKNKNVMDMAIPSSGVMMTRTFGELFHRELQLFLDIVFGVLRQSSTDAKKRKSTIKNASDAFWNFISMGLDSIGKAKVDIERIKIDKLTINKEEEMNEKEIQELITKTISDVLPESIKDSVNKSVESAIAPLKEIVEKLNKPADKQADDKNKKEDGNSQSEEMNKLTKSVADLAEKMEKLGSGLATQPAESEKDDEDSEGDSIKEKGSSSIFSGTIFSNPA